MTAGADITSGQPTRQDVAAIAGAAWRGANRFIHRYWRALSIFGLALTLRLVHTLVAVDYQVSELDDSQDFLRGAAAVWQAWNTALAGGPTALKDVMLPGAAGVEPQSVLGWLIREGPVYPLYLSLLELAAGVNPASHDFSRSYVALSVFNCLLDAFTCLVVYYAARLAFNRRVGLVAGFLFALYPAAIVNTQHFYAEPFAYFLVAVWLCLAFLSAQRHGPSPVKRLCLVGALGLCSGLIMLCRPVLLLLPITAGGVLALHALASLEGRRVRPQAAVVEASEGPDAQARSTEKESAYLSQAATGGEGRSPETTEKGSSSESVRALPARTEPDTATDGQEGGAEGGAQEGSAEGGAPEGSAEGDADGGARGGRATNSGSGPPAEPASTAVNRQTGTAPATGRPAMGARLLAPLTAFAVGLSLVLAPWLLFTHAAAGSAAMLDSGSAAASLLVGNDLTLDGWRPVAATAAADILSKPADSGRFGSGERLLGQLSLELRKVPRLWAGLWNDNAYPVPLLDVGRQEIFHQILLLLAFPGAIVALLSVFNFQLSRSFACAAVLTAVVAYHFVCVAFEPVSRNNITAMPAVVILAAFALVRMASKSGVVRIRLVALMALSIAVLSLWQSGLSTTATVASMLSVSPPVLVWIDGILWFCVFCSLGRLILPAVSFPAHRSRVRLARMIAASGFVLVAAIVLTMCVSDPGRKEWYARLRYPTQIVRQDIYVPPVAAVGALPGISFVLVDLTSPILLPRLGVAVNGQRIDHLPIPWLEVLDGDSAAVKALSRRSHAIGCDIKSFRQWWAIPIPTLLLRFGGANEVMIVSEHSESAVPLKIYGDYTQTGRGSEEAQRTLPSFSIVSMQKGFETCDRKDVRIYERVRLLGRNADAHWFDGQVWRAHDLSDSDGRQSGEYRIRIAIPARKTSDRATTANPAGLSLPPFLFAPITLVSATTPQTVVGSDARSMILTRSPLKLPEGLPPGALFFFGCEISDFDAPWSASIAVEFAGQENGRQVTWMSPWQPYRIWPPREWWPVSFADAIPERIRKLDNLTVTIKVAPFHPDQFVMKPWLARRQQVAVRNANFFILPPIDIPPPGKRSWLFY